MASFYAELRVAGNSYPVQQCTFEVQQPTHQRGRVSAKVRYEPVHLMLDVPEGDMLLAWAADSHKQLAADITFANVAGGSTIETLRLPAAYCVTYAEVFQQGETGSGAYVCHLTLVDPAGWTIQAGGPAGTFVAPAAGEHGTPVIAPTSSMEWMAGPPTNPWEGKKQSGKAYLGSPPLKRSQLQQLQVQARSQLGTDVRVLREGDEMLTMMRSMRRRAAFQASTNTIFLQPQATHYEVSHELKHAQQCAALGVAAYALQTPLAKETYVYEQLMQNRAALTPTEISHATAYINSERSKVGLASLPD